MNGIEYAIATKHDSNHPKVAQNTFTHVLVKWENEFELQSKFGCMNSQRVARNENPAFLDRLFSHKFIMDKTVIFFEKIG